jgi:HNH endonuclease
MCYSAAMTKPHPRPEIRQPIDKPYRLIPLTQNQIAIVDAEDFERLSKWHWFAVWSTQTETFYANRSGGKRGSLQIRLHHEVLGSKERTDHRNGDTLDNRKENLRPCTNAQNMANRGPQRNSPTQFRGVHFLTKRNRWNAYIYINKKPRHIGDYKTLEEAAGAFDEVIYYRFGEFARLNFPDRKPVLRPELVRRVRQIIGPVGHIP